MSSPNTDANKAKGAKVIRWGIASAGKISHDFTLALQNVENSQVVAVAARDVGRAKEFAKEFNIPQAYGSYDELARDANVDVVYIGSTNNTHFEIAKLMLESNKHVLCEKPLVTSVAETKELIAIATKNQKFLMEAIWSRFFPVYTQVKEELRKGTIGKPRLVEAKLSVPIANVDRIKLKELFGGVVLDLGVYVLQIALWVFNARPTKVQAIGNLNEEGMPVSVAINLHFPDGNFAQLFISGEFNAQCDALITGSKGDMCIKHMFIAPTELEINGKVSHHDLPKATGKMNFPNSEGMAYEARAVAEYLRSGKSESEIVSHNDSLILAELMEEIHQQLGVTF